MQNASLFSNTTHLTNYYQVLNVYKCMQCKGQHLVLNPHIVARAFNRSTQQELTVPLPQIIDRYAKIFNCTQIEAEMRYLPRLPLERRVRMHEGYVCPDCTPTMIGRVEGDFHPLPYELPTVYGPVESENLTADPRNRSRSLKDRAESEKRRAEREKKLNINKRITHGPLENLL